MEKIYIVRQILCNDFDCKRIDDEVVFSTFKKAKRYIDSIIDNKASREDLVLFRIELLEYPIDKKRGYPIKEWIYAINGCLLNRYDYDLGKHLEDFIKVEYKQKYTIGDLVYVKPNIDNMYSYSIKGEYGVILTAPVSKRKWLTDGKSKDNWDGEYIVIYITPEGIANHMHLPECALTKLDKRKLPKEFCFLSDYSNHLKGKKLLPKRLINSLLKDKVYLKKTKNYYK